MNRTVKLTRTTNKTITTAEISEETLIAFAREVTKRLEITKRYEYDILKLNLDHQLEIRKNGYCNLM